MVLDHVAEGARLVVVTPAPPGHPEFLGRGDLDRLDLAAVPERFEHGVAEPERQDVLDRLFAQVVVDPVDLILAEDARHVAVQLASAGEVVAERLLDHDPAPRAAVAIVAVDQARPGRAAR